MQSDMEGIYYNNGKYYAPDEAQKHLQFDRDTQNNMDMTFEYDGSDQPKIPNSNGPLQTVNAEVRDPMHNYRFEFKGDQNKDFANYSTRASSNEQDFILEKEEMIAPSCWGTNSFSAKFAAPVKRPQRDHYKNLLKDFDRKEFSGKAFMSKLNQWDTKEIKTSVFNDNDVEMSLENHLENLCKQYKAKNKRFSQTERENSEDLYLKVHGKAHSEKGIKVTLQSKRRYYQKLKKESTSIRIRFSDSLKYSDLEKYLKLFKDQGGSTNTIDNFFKIVSKEFWNTGVIVSIKVNSEPVFPAKMTLDYLWSQYKNSKARVVIT